ncbi:MAG: class I SAM-dependent methyltransferase [Verrucomicrobia bacterium]|nr:class I SAM-dependent methyltransferase [Verrucomicrobiota bacterium]
MRFLSILLLFSTAYARQFDVGAYYSMDQLAIWAHADKGSFFHNYTEVYSQYLQPIRNDPIKFLEIGIYKGESAKLWEAYFPRADLHLIDITFAAVEYTPTRAKYHLVNQEDPADLVRFMKEVGGEFDVILDDGSHTMNQQITSLVTLFPYLKSGGMYIIEDLHTSYWKHWPGARHPTTIEVLKSLIDEINYVGYTTTYANHLNLSEEVLNTMNIYRKDLYTIHFYDSVAILIKR